MSGLPLFRLLGLSLDMDKTTPKISRLWLEKEFEKRRAKNPAYSLRALARHLKMPSGRLSEILACKRPLTLRMAENVADRLSLDPLLRASFLEVVHQEQIQRRHRTGDVKTHVIEPEYKQLSLDAFQVISDWYHFALLNLIELEDFRVDVRWIARRLDISTVEVRGAIERLMRLELIIKKGNTYVRTLNNLATTHDISSAALRRFHRQVLERALDALENVPLEQRDITSISMSIDAAKILRAKAMIKQFRRKLCLFLESGEKNEVYQLNVQLVPVSKKIQVRSK